MLASRNHNRNKLPEGRKLERDNPIPDRMTASQLNPVWQSLAMRSGVLQPKLTLSQADDPYEREADRVADQVMRMPAPQSEGHWPSITPGAIHQTQLKLAKYEEARQPGATGFAPASPGAEPMCGDAGGGPAPDPSPAELLRAGVLGGPGEPLAPAARSELGARLGPQVDRIRVHVDGEAASRAAEMSARAYTVGGHIYFGAGEHRPDTATGRKLLAHEADHAVEQRFGRDLSRVRVQRALIPPPTKLDTQSRPPSYLDDNDPYKTEAELDKQIQKRKAMPNEYKNPADPNPNFLGQVNFQGMPSDPISGQPADRLRRAAKLALLDCFNGVDRSSFLDREMHVRVQLEAIGNSYAMVIVRINANRDAEVIFQDVSEQTHGDTSSPDALKAELSSTFNITFVASDAVNVKLPGTQKPFTFKHKLWDSGNDLALLKQALGLLGGAEKAIVNGLNFRRLQGANQNGVAGFYAAADRSLNMFDDAFPVEQDEWYLIGGTFQSGGVRTASHEIGHALEQATPAGAAMSVQQQFQTAVLAEWGKRVPPAKSFPPPAHIPLPTAYAARDWGEFFAETYSIYRVNPQFLQNAEYQYLYDFFHAQFP